MFNAYRTITKEQQYKAVIEQILPQLSDKKMTYNTGGFQLTQTGQDFIQFLKNNQVKVEVRPGFRHYSRPRTGPGSSVFGPSVTPSYQDVNAFIDFKYATKNELIDALNKLPLEPSAVVTQSGALKPT